MYSVRLNKTALQTGRDFINGFVITQLPSNNFPAGTTSALRAFIDQADESWSQYRGYFDKGYQHSAIFGLAVKAVTNATVAAELVSTLHWIPRMSYHPLAGENPTAEQKQFASETNRLLSLLWKMTLTLKSKQPQPESGSVNESDPKQLEERMQRLAFSKHVAELGVTICKPANYAYQHPDTASWLGARAKVNRCIAAALIDSARADEAEAAGISKK